MQRVQDITAKDWSPKLGAFGEVVSGVEDIAQCVRIICGTRIGAVPLRPEFGSEIYKWLDAPIDEARRNVPQAIFQALGRWEPRIIVNSVLVSMAENLAGVVIRIDWSLVLNAEQSFTTTLGNADFTQQQLAVSSTDADTLQNLEISDYKAEFLDALNN
jgi:uncharacterized protein